MDTRKDKASWNRWRWGLQRKGPDGEAGKTDEAGLSQASENNNLNFSKSGGDVGE